MSLIQNVTSFFKADLKTQLYNVAACIIEHDDIFVFVLSGLLVCLVFSITPWGDTGSAVRSVLILAIIISYVFKLKPYEKSSSPRPFMAGLADELARLTIVFGCAFFLVFVMVGLAPLGIWSCLVWGVTGCGLKAISFTLRRKYYPAFKERSLYVKNVAIICVNEHSAELARRVIQENNNIRIEGFFDDRKGRVNPDELPYPYLGTIDDLLEKGYNETLDQIIIALPGAAAERLDEIFEKVSILPLSIVMSPELAVLNRPRSLLQANSRLQFIQLDENPMIGWRRYTSAFIDIVGSSTALILFSPLFLIISILIKLESPGPVFYKQKRYGYNNKLFDCYKFRSMSQEACDSSEKEIKLTEREDPRVTRVGHFIRRTSLDEIPQFINVLKGDMSLIGPRPHPPGVRAGGRVYEEVIGDFARRYKVKPGLTGWAQVNGARGNTFTEEDLRTRFAYDLDYIQNWSLWLDIVIIMRTVFLGFTGKNAF